jgi:K+-transporting ATPase ATPase A chain
LIPAVISEMNGNPAISHMGIAQNMEVEGKKFVLVLLSSANWATYTTVTSNGSKWMHDSMTPMQHFGMMINCFMVGWGGF